MRLRIGVIGAGLIGQVEHIPNLLRLKKQFEVVGVSDPSATARNFITDTYGIKGFAGEAQLLDEKLDALVVASPDPLHHEHVLAGLARGLDVFCEKPLCYGVAEIDEIIAARNKAGKVMQVGYMKRFDPHYQAAMTMMPGTRETLRYVSVEVNDPDSWPFVQHHPMGRGDDVAKELIEQTKAKQRAQIEKALGTSPDTLTFGGYCHAYGSSLVHDINAVHGLLDALDVPDGTITGAQIFAGGRGGQGSVRLMDGKAMWNMVHLAVPKLADYKERVTFFFEDSILELVFPSPYLNHQPTRLTIKTSRDHTLHCDEIRVGYGEAFIEELSSFWEAIVNGAPVRNLPEHARRDMALVAGLARKHMEN